MGHPARLKRKLILLTWIALAGGLAGLSYVTSLASVGVFPFNLGMVQSGVLNGATITTLIGLLEMMIWHAPYGAPLRRLPFLARLAIKTTAYTVVIVGTLTLFNAWLLAESTGVEDPWVYIRDYLPMDALVSFKVALIIHFVVQTRLMIGGRVLTNIVLGRYARPRQENRMFLFVDLADSSMIARCLGDIETHALISRVFFDLDGVISAHGGEVHRYVGDQVVITWPLDAAIRDGRCLHCALEIHALLERRALWYRRRHGIAPRVRAGLYGGPVAAGECGDSKLEIVYFGETVNMAARLEQAAKTLDRWLLMPSDLADQMPAALPGWTRVDLGPVPLKGHELPVTLTCFEPVALDSSGASAKKTPSRAA